MEGVLIFRTSRRAFYLYEAYLASLLGRLIGNYADEHDLGIVAGADGTLGLFPHQVRIPDVSFVCWDRLPGRRLPAEPIPQLVPDLAVEVISEGNTEEEMERKLHEYFQAGVCLVWYVYPASHSVRVYTNPDEVTELSGEAVLDGGDVLPGYRSPSCLRCQERVRVSRSLFAWAAEPTWTGDSWCWAVLECGDSSPLCSCRGAVRGRDVPYTIQLSSHAGGTEGCRDGSRYGEFWFGGARRATLKEGAAWAAKRR